MAAFDDFGLRHARRQLSLGSLNNCPAPMKGNEGVGRCGGFAASAGPTRSLFGCPQGGRLDVARGPPASPKIADLAQVEIDHGRRIEREELRQQEAADNGDAERAP